ncbi:MAG: GFA family protein [Pseudomonadota bacterium]
MTTTGSCLCKKTTWAYEGDVTWACYCHCVDCRRNCSSPVVAWLGVPKANFKWTGGPVKTLQSSKGVYRHFCPDCGAPMGFEADHYPVGMHLYAGSLDEPQKFEPTFHVNWESKLPWLHLEDDLPKYIGRLEEQGADKYDYS